MKNSKRRLISFMLSLSMVAAGLIVPFDSTFSLNSQVSMVSAEESITIDSLPSEYQESMDWIWQNRILDEKSTDRWNLIFDQIVAGDGTLNYVIRWQSSTALTYEQRQKFESMLERQINAWTDWLVGFEGWTYDHVNVNIVGWAVSDESLILDKHDDEVVYTTCTTDELHSSNSAIPEVLPYAPSENSRAEHFYDTSYEYPGTRFDMYLWGTTSFEGGAGGDWGQRVSDEYILSVLDSQDAHIIEHEIGHGFGMTDFYEDSQCPTWPEDTTNIMVAGWATEVTDYDGWMLRYIWDKIKDETQDGVARFNLPESSGGSTTTEVNQNKTFEFNISNTDSYNLFVNGAENSKVTANFYILDSNGNILRQTSKDGLLDTNPAMSITSNIEGATTLRVVVSSYTVWDSTANDYVASDVDGLNVYVNHSITETLLLGDLNFDNVLSPLDVLILKKHLFGISIITDTSTFEHADVNQDGSINVTDLCMLKNLILYPKTNNGNVTDDTNNGNNIDDNPSKDDGSNAVDTSDFITAPIAQLAGSLPSQGDASLVIFYIDFPDCTYSNKLTTEEIQELAFGSADETSANYPFESMSAFFSRSSKGTMNLSGQVFTYTAKNSIEYYNENKVALAEECFDAFNDSIDFSIFDSDGDGLIDATLFTVPGTADDDYWWPCSGAFGDDTYTIDGVKVGNIITGNETPDDNKSFNSSYLHEMGHCFGLPDYYLYYSGDEFDSMTGTAGSELMDGDAYSDFSAFSKLMLGWYREDQVQVYDSTQGTQTFTLNSAQTDNGNCVIIPYGDLDSSYFSEYFIIEYTTESGNNSLLSTDIPWMACESGIRIHHIKADMYDNGWWCHLKYENGSEFTKYDDDGIRLIRLVNDGNGCFKTGDTINSNTSGFGWYDSNEEETIDPNVTISIGELTGDSYTITISSNN